MQERRKQIFSKPNINKSKKQDNDDKDNSRQSNTVTEHSIDEPYQQVLQTVPMVARRVEHSKNCDDDDDDNVKLELLLNSKKLRKNLNLSIYLFGYNSVYILLRVKL